MNKKLVHNIDWLEYTLFSDLKETLLMLQIDTNGISECGGRLGYKKGLTIQDILILHDGKKEMGIHVRLSGKALAQYVNVKNLMERIIKAQGKITRLDLALTIEKHKLTIEEVTKRLQKGLVSSRWREYSLVESAKISGEKTGKTLYLGKRSSNVFCRYYDKKAESNGLIDGERLELELKKEAADIAAREIVNGRSSSKVMIDILSKYIKIFSEKKGQNKARWVLDKEYQSLIRGAESIKMTKPQELKTLEEYKKIWEKQSAGMTLAIVNCENDWGWIVECLKRNQGKLKNKYKKLIEEELAKNGRK